MQPSGSLNASRIDNMNLQINLRPDSNQPQTLTVPILDENGNPTFDNTTTPPTPRTVTVVNPSYVPNRGKANVMIYAKNHNVLRIVNGFAGLLFKI
jgi:hypothetical protein